MRLCSVTYHNCGSLKMTTDGFPIVNAYKGDFPNAIVGFEKSGQNGNSIGWIHGFTYDYVLEKIWSHSNFILDKIPVSGALISPDFSMYLELSENEKKYNMFRRHAVAQFAQNNGRNVIHTLNWAELASLDYCFNGVEPEGIYAVSNIGYNQDYITRKLFSLVTPRRGR